MFIVEAIHVSLWQIQYCGTIYRRFIHVFSSIVIAAKWLLKILYLFIHILFVCVSNWVPVRTISTTNPFRWLSIVFPNAELIINFYKFSSNLSAEEFPFVVFNCMQGSGHFHWSNCNTLWIFVTSNRSSQYNFSKIMQCLIGSVVKCLNQFVGFLWKMFLFATIPACSSDITRARKTYFLFGWCRNSSKTDARIRTSVCKYKSWWSLNVWQSNSWNKICMLQVSVGNNNFTF